MTDRETIVPLVLGLCVAVLSHALVVPLMARVAGPSSKPKAKANLLVSKITAPDEADAGERIDVSFQVANLGLAPTPASEWADGLYLSRDGRRSVDDVPLLTLRRDKPLNVGEDYDVTVQVALPNDRGGDMFLLAVTDAQGAVLESDESVDNVAATPLHVRVPPKPDLAVTSMTTPDTLRADEPFTIAFEVANEGEQALGSERSWRDAVLLSRDRKIDDGDVLLSEQTVSGPLRETERAMRTFEGLAVPADYRGPVYVIAQTDRGDAIDERGREDNNTRAMLVRIIEPQPQQTARAADAPKPDLTVQAIDAPREVIAGEPFAMRYDVANVGEVTASPSDWLNSVYVSKDDKLDSDDAVLHTRPPRGNIAPGGAQTLAVDEAAIEERFAGEAFLIVQADSDNRLAERREDNNTAAVPIEVLIPHRVDEDEVRLGDDEAPKQQRIAWIPYESFQELLAPQSETKQPAIQDMVDPAPVTRSTPDPTPPAPTAAAAAPQPSRQPAEPMQGEDQREQEQAEAPRQAPADPAAQPASEPRQPQMAQAPASPPMPREEPTQMPRIINRDESASAPSAEQPPEEIEPEEDDERKPGEVESETEPPEPAERTDAAMDQSRPQPQRDEQPEQQPADTAVPDPEGEPVQQQRERPSMPASVVAAATGQPTPVPRADAQADPVSLRIDSKKIRPGQVITGEGIEIRTARPDISQVARSSIMPLRHPVAVVRFDRTGEVIKAYLATDTGQNSWDSPIISSLYEWHARGKKLEELDGPFEIEIEMLISR